MNSNTVACPLCHADDTALKATVDDRPYLACGRCHLVFLEPAERLDAGAERRHYLTHENNPADEGYRAFLQPLARAMQAKLENGARGLDYGCGPGPTLSVMLREQGFTVRDFDPFFAPDHALLQQRYEFITCSETAEHFHAPADEFARFDTLLNPGGWLGIMTQWYDERTDFTGWHYVRDPTHVCFYSIETLQWLAVFHGWRLWLPEANIAQFQKPL